MRKDWQFWALVVMIVGAVLTQAVGYGSLTAEVQHGKEERAMLSTTIVRLTDALDETNKQLNIITGEINARRERRY